MKVDIFNYRNQKIATMDAAQPIKIGQLIDELTTDSLIFREDIDIQRVIKQLDKNYDIKAESVLLVDDDQSFLDLSKHYLQKLGHYVECYTTAEQAYNVFNRNPTRYNRLIVDQNMPNVTGNSFIDLIEGESEHLHTCILTANIDTVPEGYASKYMIIQKPCNMVNIVGAASKKHVTINGVPLVK